MALIKEKTAMRVVCSSGCFFILSTVFGGMKMNIKYIVCKK